MSRIDNIVLDNVKYHLRQAYKKSRAPIWFATLKYLSKSSSMRPSVNIGKISKLTKEGDVVLVPGKVLGSGVITHKITVGAYSFSEKAFWKIQKAGGNALSLVEFIKNFPDGKRGVLIGG